jgi:hypothetical protein
VIEAGIRWPRVTTRVVTQEIQQFALVHNLLSAISTATDYERPNLPAVDVRGTINLIHPPGADHETVRRDRDWVIGAFDHVAILPHTMQLKVGLPGVRRAFLDLRRPPSSAATSPSTLVVSEPAAAFRARIAPREASAPLVPPPRPHFSVARQERHRTCRELLPRTQPSARRVSALGAQDTTGVGSYE